MKTEMFEELLDSVREAGAILRGQKKPSPVRRKRATPAFNPL